nr:PREDICTED: protein UPSTREAM OF FLC [Musa acuminata subsp. malaccensis]
MAEAAAGPPDSSSSLSLCKMDRRKMLQALQGILILYLDSTMAAAYRGRAEHSRIERETSPARAAVVYYLSRNGHLEHPHFMEVPLSSSSGLYLRDVINRLHVLRGRAMVGLYSWSSKRSYRNGYVWQDLSEDDFIHPVHGNEYVLKGTELLHLNSSSSSGSQELFLPSSTISKCAQEDSAVSFSRGKQATRSSFYKSNTSAETTANSIDASTQTEEHKRQQRRAPVAEVERAENPKSAKVAEKHPATELSGDEVSPPPSSSSPETLEALIKADGRCIMAVRPEEKGWSVGGCLSGRVKASAVLMHLISCGSISAKANGLSLMPQYSGRLDRAESMGHMPSFRSISLEDKEVFTDKMRGDDDDGELPPVLKKSSSYDADRGSKMNLAKEVEDDRARCMPRKAKTRKEGKPQK